MHTLYLSKTEAVNKGVDRDWPKCHLGQTGNELNRQSKVSPWNYHRNSGVNISLKLFQVSGAAVENKILFMPW